MVQQDIIAEFQHLSLKWFGNLYDTFLIGAKADNCTRFIKHFLDFDDFAALIVISNSHHIQDSVDNNFLSLF